MTLKSALLLPLTLIFTITTSLSFDATANIYTWTDKNGKTHYSDRPFTENGAQAQVKIIKPNEHNSVAVVSRQDSQWQKDYLLSQEKKVEAQALTKQTRQKNQAMCKHLTNQMAVHDKQGRLYKIDENGERDYQTSEQIDNDKKRLKKELKKYCR